MTRINAFAGFNNFDDTETYAKFEEAVLDGSTSNFVIEFDNENASVAVDLDEASLHTYLTTARASRGSTRWINIFAPDQQPLLVKRIAQYYQFSPRLAGIMCSKQYTPRPVGSPSTTTHHHANGQPKSSRTDRTSTESHSFDLEMHNIDGNSISDSHVLLDLSHYKLVNEVWHYNSVDWASHRKIFFFDAGIAY